MDRRQFLQALSTALATTLAVAATNPAVAARAQDALPSGGVTPTRREDLESRLRHLLNRTSFGPRPGDLDRIRELGLGRYLDQQLHPELMDLGATESRLTNYLTLDNLTQDLYRVKAADQPAVAEELIGATILRAAHSPAQLLEVMVNFWSEHFSIYHQKGLCLVFKTVDDRDVIRAHALGKFGDLLRASAKSPAMLIYLDGTSNHKDQPNENYARELLELHTVTSATFTEADVQAVARAFTGWTVEPSRVDGFYFAANIHDASPHQVLGVTIPMGGIEQGERILDLLATHPATAKHIATKLCRRFIGDAASAAIIDQVTARFLETEGDIRDVLRTILTAEEFYAAPPRFKRPFEFALSLLRALTWDMHSPVNPVTVPQALRNMRHLPFDWPSPNGYSDRDSDWYLNFTERWKFVYRAVNGNLGGLVDLGIPVDGSTQIPFETLAVQWSDRLLQQPLPAEALQLIRAFVTNSSADALNVATSAGRQALSELIVLLACSPAFQYR